MSRNAMDSKTQARDASAHKGAWLVFSAMAVMYVFSMFYRVSTAIIASDLSREFGLSPERLSLLGAGFFYAFACAQLPLGPALDRLGPRRIVLGATVLGAVGAAVFAAGRTWETLLLGRVLMGLGMAPVLMGSLKLFSAWFAPAAFGTVSGLVQAIGGLGALLAATPMAALVALVGWRQTFLIFGGLTLLGTVLIFGVVRDVPQGTAPASLRHGRGLAGGFRKVLSRGSFWAMVPLCLAGYASIACLQGLWAGPYFMDFLGYSRVETANILLALGVSGVLGTVAAGYFSDRVLRSRKWGVLGGVVPSALLMAPLLGFGAPASSAGWALDFAAIGLFSAARSLIYAHAKESTPPELTGTAVTSVNFFIMVGPALMQQAMGFALQVQPGNYTLAFLIPAASLAVGALAYAFTRDTRPGAP